jgi:NAD(P)-dependent dehydrogenase (short-subunit alcohol dehydrogenase family)
VLDINEPTLDHPNLFWHQCDLIDRDQIHEIFKKLPGLDIVILNAGKTMIESMDHIDLDQHRKIFELNYFSALQIIKLSLPLLSPGGQIVGVSTIGVFKGVCGAAPYFASKSALSVLLESYRIELFKKKSDITVTLIHPGFIKTKMSNSKLLHHSFSVSVEAASKKILSAVACRRKLYSFPLPMRILTFLNRLLPSWPSDWVNARLSKLHSLPSVKSFK